MADSDPAYIARKPCGCIVAVTVDRPEYRRSVAKDTATWIRQGLNVERTTVGEARADPTFLRHPCEHDEAEKAGVSPDQLEIGAA